MEEVSMIEYTVKKNEAKNGRVYYVPIFENESYGILGEFLTVEVESFKGSILDVIQKAERRPDRIEFAGNCCLLSIEDGMARIEGMIDDANSDMSVEIRLQELDDLVTAWIRDVRQQAESSSDASRALNELVSERDELEKECSEAERELEQYVLEQNGEGGYSDALNADIKAMREMMDDMDEQIGELRAESMLRGE
jgi:methyl-accepting chemotaxis protein